MNIFGLRAVTIKDDKIVKEWFIYDTPELISLMK
jgi:hypothetical protein